jgi:hypothetical protein
VLSKHGHSAPLRKDDEPPGRGVVRHFLVVRVRSNQSHPRGTEPVFPLSARPEAHTQCLPYYTPVAEAQNEPRILLQSGSPVDLLLPPYIAAQAPERSGETRGKCPEKARSRSGHALVASWSCTGSCGLSMTTSTPESADDFDQVHLQPHARLPVPLLRPHAVERDLRLSRQPQQRPLGFRDLLAQVLFQNPIRSGT